MLRNAILIAATLTVVGCSTDLDINAPYKDITIVYGLLNQRDSVHFIKVNKAFLGEGDATVYAMIPDSNEYRDEDISFAKVYRVVNGQRVDSFPLLDTLITNREPGDFYSPDQKMFYFLHPATTLPFSGVTVYLEQDSEYELDLVVKGKRVTSTARIVNDFSINSADQSLLAEVNLVGGSTGYGSFELNWRSNKDGKRYVAYFRLTYSEVRGTDTLHKEFRQPIGTVVSPNSQSVGDMSAIMDGQLFFSNLGNAVPDDPTVDKRIVTGLDFLFTVANDEFHTFLSLSEPVSGIVEERPDYTNVEGGNGIFASRYTKDVIGKRFNDATLNELMNGQYTATKLFCASYRVGPPYGCD